MPFLIDTDTAFAVAIPMSEFKADESAAMKTYKMVAARKIGAC